VQPRTHYARSPEGSVGYQVVGDGALDLVFIPWWATNLDVMWEEPSIARFLSRLAGFSRLILFDKRGTGISDPLPLAALPTLEQWSDDVSAVMAAAGSQRAALFGHSQGGQMALLFAATHPERTTALILADSSARQFDEAERPSSFSVDQRALSLESVERSWGSGATLDFLAPSAAGDERFRRWYGRYERLSLGPRMVRAVVAADFENDLRGILPAIRVPTLVLHRRGNRFIRSEHGRRLAEGIPGARFVEIPGDDHLFHVGETEALLGEVEEFLTGARPLPEADRVLATLLFTDIVGSTERAAELGDRAWRGLLDAHQQIARRELERHRGRAIEFAGDGLLATFDGPARAIRCACAIAAAVRELGLEIRAGLHTGEIELAGAAVRGIAVHIGARVAALAGPGEVLVSSLVKDLVAGSGIRLRDRGVHELKGVPDAWRLFAVDGEAKS
jgi:pimeloyl-ACP methyl ester carboxylesterase